MVAGVGDTSTGPRSSNSFMFPLAHIFGDGDDSEKGNTSQVMLLLAGGIFSICVKMPDASFTT